MEVLPPETNCELTVNELRSKNDDNAFEKPALPSLFSREKPKIKTFSRKKEKQVLPKPKITVSNDDMNWSEVAELSSRAANAFQQKDDFNEFCQLMKAATGENQVDLNLIQKVQKKLCITHENANNVRSQVTFHVGQNKANIDLPTQESSMAVNDSTSAVQVMLSAESDGIGNVQLFVNLILILYARWRFKVFVYKQSSLRSQFAIDFQLQFS